MEISFLDAVPTPAQYNYLRSEVGWGIFDENEIKKGLHSTLYSVCAFDSKKIVGMGRVIGDGKLVFYIQDVVVLPEYQKKKIGSAIMDKLMAFIDKNSVNNTIVGLMSAYEKENFYEKYGFTKRPDNKFGCGMTKFISK